MTNPLTPRRTRQRFEQRKSVTDAIALYHQVMQGRTFWVGKGYWRRIGIRQNKTIDRRDHAWIWRRSMERVLQLAGVPWPKEWYERPLKVYKPV